LQQDLTLKLVMKRILFICLGNICRSPAADGIMKHLVAERGLEDEFLIDSAGIGSWHVGQLPDYVAKGTDIPSIIAPVSSLQRILPALISSL